MPIKAFSDIFVRYKSVAIYFNIMFSFLQVLCFIFKFKYHFEFINIQSMKSIYMKTAINKHQSTFVPASFPCECQ